MTTTTPMFTTEAAAAEWHLPLPAEHIILAGEGGYWAAAGDVMDAAETEFTRDMDPDGAAFEQASDTVRDAVNNAWSEGLSHDEWVSAALRRLRS